MSEDLVKRLRGALAEAARARFEAADRIQQLELELAAEKALADQVQKLVAIAVDQYGARQSASSGKESRDWQSMKMASLDIQQAMQSACRKARGL